MAARSDRGLFVTVEGVEGGGKTTQARMLVNALRKQGYPVLFTREPGGTPLGEKLREIIIDRDNDMDPLTETFLFAASRREHVTKVILPTLADGITVVCDRFCDATVAYQAYGRGVSLDDVLAINRMAAWGVRPDMTLCLDLEPALGMERVAQRYRKSGGALDRLEQMDAAFFQRIREAYLEMMQEDPDRFRRLDAAKSVEAVHEEIMALLEEPMRTRYPKRLLREFRLNM